MTQTDRPIDASPDEGAVRGQIGLVAERIVHRVDGACRERNGFLPGAVAKRLFRDAPGGIAEFPRDGAEEGFAGIADLGDAIALRAVEGRGRQAVVGLDEPHGAVADPPSFFFRRVGEIEERLVRRTGTVHVDVVVEGSHG